MTPHDLSVLGDRRGFLIDIDIKALLNVKMYEEERAETRKLHTTNIKATKKYLQLLEERFEKQNIFDRVHKLYYQWRSKEKNKWEVKKQYEKIDTEIYNICKKAEKKCTREKSGKYDWSPKLDKAIKALAYWSAVLQVRVDLNNNKE